MRFVPINSVKEGSQLAKTIFDKEGRILLSEGVKLSESLLRRVKANNIFSIYIHDEYSQNEIEDIIKPELRQKAIKLIKDSFASFTKGINQNSNNKMQAVKIKYEYTNSINQLVKDILDDILSRQNIFVNLVDIKSMDNYTYEHSVNVTLLSLIIGIELNLNKDQLFELAVGAMLHDLGKTFVPVEILFKAGALKAEEFEIIKNHTTKGYEYLKNNIDISGVSRMVILQHHERIDGKGYPLNLKGQEINNLAKIVTIADVYDALTSDRPYRRAMSPNEALEYLMGGVDRFFEYQYVKAFIRRVIPYPEGTLVKLSSGDIAVIDKVNVEYPLRPQVRVIKQFKDRQELIGLDLLNEKNLTILGVHYDAPAAL
ncbi:MAG: HD-GYP domain-containing protein [Flavobacteriales bacterium]|nr:HD-GYP domain-containing protein [Flavobacteriales bacterium]